MKLCETKMIIFTFSDIDIFKYQFVQPMPTKSFRLAQLAQLARMQKLSPCCQSTTSFFYEGTFVAFASGHNLVVDYFQPQAVFQIQRSIKTQIDECKKFVTNTNTLLNANTSTQEQIQNCNLVVVLVRPQAISQNPLQSFLQLVVVHKNEENIPLSLLACK